MAIAHSFKFATSYKKHVPKHANLGIQCIFHKDQSLKVWWKAIQNWQRSSTFVEIMYFLYSLGVVTFNKRWKTLSILIFFSLERLKSFSVLPKTALNWKFMLEMCLEIHLCANLLFLAWIQTKPSDNNIAGFFKVINKSKSLSF